MATENHKKRKSSPTATMSNGARRCREMFLRFFPDGFADPKYFEWERGYKQVAHDQWNADLNRKTFRALLKEKEFGEIAARAVRIESRTNLLFSFEKMAVRDAVKSADGARAFAESLFEFLHGAGEPGEKFERWVAAVAALPRRQTRVLTWTNVTVFGFLAEPETHIFLKPNTTRNAARAYDFEFPYQSRPSWETYARLLEFAETIRRDQSDLRPRDMFDLQSFIWVVGSQEYKDL